VTRRYWAGSFADTLAPANAGEVVRVALLARAIGSEGAAFTTIGVAAAVSVVRASMIAVVFQHPLAAALVIVPALELAGLLPLTPGNIGVTSAAVTLALRGRGVPLAPALGTGIALHAVQTLVGVTFGGVCALSLAPRLPSRVGRVLIASAAATVLIAAATTAVLGARPELA
jgi:uncharacterized membrane protein YbhN (UPF0104 family)